MAPKGRLTPFFFYYDAKGEELREAGRMRVSTNEVIDYWNALSDAERKPFEEKAAQACAAYFEECKERALEGREATFAVTKSTETFLERCVWDAARVTSREKRKTIMFRDVVASMRQHPCPESMQFFVEEFAPEPPKQEPKPKAGSKRKATDKATANSKRKATDEATGKAEASGGSESARTASDAASKRGNGRQPSQPKQAGKQAAKQPAPAPEQAAPSPALTREERAARRKGAA